MPRSYVIHLQDCVKELELELASLTTASPPTKHNIDSVGRGVSVKIKEGDEYPRFLGPSSGIAMTRLVLEMARDLWDAKSIREVITEQKAQELKEKYRNESATDRRQLKEQVDSLAREKSTLQADLARAQSQLTLASERYDMLQSNFTALRNENNEFQKRSQQLAEQAAKQDLRTQQVAE